MNVTLLEKKKKSLCKYNQVKDLQVRSPWITQWQAPLEEDGHHVEGHAKEADNRVIQRQSMEILGYQELEQARKILHWRIQRDSGPANTGILYFLASWSVKE